MCDFDVLQDGGEVLKTLSSGVTTSGTSGSLAYFWNSACTAGERGIQVWSIPLKRKKERTFTE